MRVSKRTVGREARRGAVGPRLVSRRTVRRLGQAWLALVAMLLLAGLALSADAAWRAIAGPVAEPPTPVSAEPATVLPPPPLDTPAPVEAAAPAAGVTGTTALPAMPVPALAATAADLGVVAARPFSLARASGVDRDRALQCLTAAVYYEAASEPDAGQRAVAQVVLNRVRHPAFPPSVCGVVYQGSERAGCQFSFACDGAMARTPSAAGWARAARAAGAALAGYVYAPVGLATHYHTYAVTPAWNRSLVMTDMVGAHLFHRWKGWWGTAAAFAQAYRGAEPLPGPHAPIVAPVPPAIAAAVGPPPPMPVTPRAQVQPAYAESGAAVALPRAAATDALPPASQILDRWKDSGQPLDAPRNAGRR